MLRAAKSSASPRQVALPVYPPPRPFLKWVGGKTQLLEQVKGHFAEEMKARPDEVSSVLRAVVSQLDVSIERALR